MTIPLASALARRLAAQAGLTLRALVREDDGQDLIEYAFLAAFVGIAGYLTLNTIVPIIGTTYSSWLDPTTGSAYLWEPAEAWTSSGS